MAESNSSPDSKQSYYPTRHALLFDPLYLGSLKSAEVIGKAFQGLFDIEGAFVSTATQIKKSQLSLNLLSSSKGFKKPLSLL
jgi:hypothetical protein